MGREIEAVSARRGHDVVWTLDSRHERGGHGLTPERLSGADVVFEFTNPASASGNLLGARRDRAPPWCAERPGGTGTSRGLPRRSSPAAERSSTPRTSRSGCATSSSWPGSRPPYPAAGYAAFLVEEHHAESATRLPGPRGRSRRSSRRSRASLRRLERARRDRSRAPPARFRVARGRGGARSPRPWPRGVRARRGVGGRARRRPEGCFRVRELLLLRESATARKERGQDSS